MAKQQPKSAPKKAEPKGTAVSTELKDKTMVLIQDQVPDHLQGKTQGAGRGSENVGTEDLVIPRLEVLQALSPMCTRANAEYNKSAEPGMLTNSVTNQLYGKEVFVVPVHYSKQWLVWKDRQKGGGFFGAYPDPEAAKDRVNQEGGEEAGVLAIDTPTHLCLLINRETNAVDEVIVSMPRTKAKISRQWNSMIRMAGGDRFARVYRITSNAEKNAKGEYFNFAVAQSGFPAKGLYAKAEKLWASIDKGRTFKMDTTGFDPGEEGGAPSGDDGEM